MREKTTVYLDAEVKRQAMDFGLNISRVAENALRKALTQLGSEKRVEVSETNAEAPSINWESFRTWLHQNCRPVTVADRFNYAQRYQELLFRGDLSELTTLPKEKQLHVIKALSSLAKFSGLHKQWKELKERYGIKGTGVSADELLIKRLTRVQDPKEMFRWIRKVNAQKPKLSSFMDFMAATGLRFEEAIQSNNLIIKLASENRLSEYYNQEKGVLEHYKFKETFIRRTKKAFVSFVSPGMVEALSRGEPLNADGVKSGLRWRHLRIRFSEVRELHGSLLSKHLKESEIDFLHGRVGTSTFMRNYFNPAWISDLRTRTEKAVAEILKEI